MTSNLQKLGKTVPKIELTESELQNCMSEIKSRMANMDLTEAQALARLDVGKIPKHSKNKKKKRREGLVQERIISVSLIS